MNIPKRGQPALPSGRLAQGMTIRGMTVALALALSNLKDLSSGKQLVILILPCCCYRNTLGELCIVMTELHKFNFELDGVINHLAFNKLIIITIYKTYHKNKLFQSWWSLRGHPNFKIMLRY